MKLKLKKALKQKLKAGPVSAKAVLLSNGKILILRQQNGNWDLPGGKVNDDESVTEALVREVWEETRLTVIPVDLLTSSMKQRPHAEDLLVMSYLCEIKEQTEENVIQLSDEHVAYELLELSEALALPMHQHYASALMKAQKHINKQSSTAA